MRVLKLFAAALLAAFVVLAGLATATVIALTAATALVVRAVRSSRRIPAPSPLGAADRRAAHPPASPGEVIDIAATEIC